MISISRINPEDTIEIRHKVLWPEKKIDYVRIENDDDGIHYGLYLDGKLISVVSVFINQDEAQFRKFATLDDYQNKGYGSTLFRYMLNELNKLDVVRVWCNAREDANKFYRRFGFNNASSERFYKGDVSYIIMEKFFE